MKRSILLAVCALLVSGACNLTTDLGNAWGTGGASVKTCGGKTAPACPEGCEPGCYHPPMFTGPGQWECDPIDPAVTPPGVCGDAGACFVDGVSCAQDAECCSLVCSEQGVCEACRADLEGCSEASQCCSGVCSLNACGG